MFLNMWNNLWMFQLHIYYCVIFNVFIWYVFFSLSSCLVIWGFCFLSLAHNLRTFWMIILHRYIQSGTWSTNAWAIHLNWETNGHLESIINIFTEMTKCFSSMFDLFKKKLIKKIWQHQSTERTVLILHSIVWYGVNREKNQTLWISIGFELTTPT